MLGNKILGVKIKHTLTFNLDITDALLAQINFLNFEDKSSLIVSATRKRRDIKIHLCPSAPVRKSLIY